MGSRTLRGKSSDRLPEQVSQFTQDWGTFPIQLWGVHPRKLGLSQRP